MSARPASEKPPAEEPSGAPDRDPALHWSVAGPQLPAHLYLHVPFCNSKCSYCDFYSVTGTDPDTFELYRRAVEAELVRWSDAALPGVVETVYVGGGTPTVLPHLERLVNAVVERFEIHARPEITVEANPGTLTPALLRALRTSGVTRVSLGAQSFSPGELKMLGRTHTAGETREACHAVLETGLDLSLDLISDIPGQTASSWVSTLEKAVETGARHISAYPLSLEEGTPMKAAFDAGLFPGFPDSSDGMMLLTQEFLEGAGLHRYEVANYAAPGCESRHNLSYWTGRQYIGVGPSAHSMFDADTARAIGLLSAEEHAAGVARVRTAEPASLERWFTSDGREVERLDAGEVGREDVMLGLRLVRGVPAEEVEHAGLGAVMADLSRDGYVESVEGRWRTTRLGWLFGNEVFSRVWLGE